MSLLCLPLPDKAIKPFFSTSPKTVSEIQLGTGAQRPSCCIACVILFKLLFFCIWCREEHKWMGCFPFVIPGLADLLNCQTQVQGLYASYSLAWKALPCFSEDSCHLWLSHLAVSDFLDVPLESTYPDHCLILQLFMHMYLLTSVVPPPTRKFS